MPELHELSALDLAAAYRRGDTSPREVVDALLARVDAFGDAVGAFVTVTAEAARQGADRAGAAFRADRAGAPLLRGFRPPSRTSTRPRVCARRSARR
jgi:amidase